MILPVVKFEQNGSTFYQGVARAGELVNTARVDEWKSDKSPEEQGYQRKPLPSHYNKIARYLVNEKKTSKLPTTILLNLRIPAKFREVKVVEKGTLGILRLSAEDLKELYIVDGQHRVYGLKAAIEEFGEELYKDFPIPITIMEVAKKIDEVKQFHIINTTSKRVATDLSERLLKELAFQDSSEEQKLKSEGIDWKIKAMEIVDIVNSNVDSVWFERIQKPNEKKVGSVVVSQTSFVESLKPLLIPGGFLSRYSTASAAEAINRLWTAVYNIMPEAFETPKEYSIQKTAGIHSIHMIAPNIFEFCRNNLDVECIENILLNARDILTEEFWHKTGEAGLYTNKKGNRMLAHMIKDCLPELENDLEL